MFSRRWAVVCAGRDPLADLGSHLLSAAEVAFAHVAAGYAPDTQSLPPVTLTASPDADTRAGIPSAAQEAQWRGSEVDAVTPRRRS